MRLAALTRVKIDGDIIEEFVRHTSQFVDKHFIVDNMSPDSTREILSALQDEGFALEVIDDPIIEIPLTRMSPLVRKILYESNADFILMLDADEFIKAASRQELELALSDLPPGSHALVPWQTYVPTIDDPEDKRTLARICWRRRTESQSFTKVFVGRSFLANNNESIALGKHSIHDPTGFSRMVELKNVFLAHFPVRDRDQIQCKALIGTCAWLALGESNREFAYQWRRIYARMQTGIELSRREFNEIAMRYLDLNSDDPIDLEYDPMPPVIRRHAVGRTDLLTIAIAYLDQFARAYGMLRSEMHGQVPGVPTL